MMAKLAMSGLMMRQHQERKEKGKTPLVQAPFPEPPLPATPTSQNPSTTYPNTMLPLSQADSRDESNVWTLYKNIDHFSPISAATLRRSKPSLGDLQWT
jgi:hypothetical protein